jgi:hypothetical protein
VINLEHSIAITQNYVSKANLIEVLGFLNKNRTMISGYGNADDCACVGFEGVEAPTTVDQQNQRAGQLPSARGIEANQLYENFVAALRRHRSDDLDLMGKLEAFESTLSVSKQAKVGFWEGLHRHEAEDTVFTLFG